MKSIMVIKKIFRLINGEFLLDDHPTGGGVIAFRSLWCSFFLFVAALSMYEMLNPNSTLVFSFNELRKVAYEEFEWFGAIFVAVYVALYTRFSAQWAYLAQLFNQITQSRAELPDQKNFKDKAVSEWAKKIKLTKQDERYAIWMAGFVADAMEMHLERKGIFCECVYTMLDNKGVKEAFLDGAEENQIELDEFYAWYGSRK